MALAQRLEYFVRQRDIGKPVCSAAAGADGIRYRSYPLWETKQKVPVARNNKEVCYVSQDGLPVTIAAPTITSTLLRVSDSDVYYSLGPYLEQKARGLGVYRKSRAMKRADEPEDDYRFLEDLRSEHWDHYRRPRAVEIYPALLRNGDDPDRVALLVHHLRRSQGHTQHMMKMPALLSYERLIREYVTQFTLEEGIDD